MKFQVGEIVIIAYSVLYMKYIGEETTILNIITSKFVLECLGSSSPYLYVTDKKDDKGNFLAYPEAYLRKKTFDGEQKVMELFLVKPELIKEKLDVHEEQVESHDALPIQGSFCN